MESCPRFKYPFLATYPSLPKTRPFLGPAVHAPTGRKCASALQMSLWSWPSDPLSSASRLPHFIFVFAIVTITIETQACSCFFLMANHSKAFTKIFSQVVLLRSDPPIERYSRSTLQLSFWFDLLLPFFLYLCGNLPNASAFHSLPAWVTNWKLSSIGVLDA
jgi:hypothetical protein